MLNDQVVSFYEHEPMLPSVPTDWETEHCGLIEQHVYQLYLAIEDIDHINTKAKSDEMNGICERFHRTTQEVFYAVAFSKKIHRSIKKYRLI